MEYQLREYRVKPGEMDEWVQEWREKIYPLRIKYGFKVIGGWVDDKENRFVWILGFDTLESSFADAEKRYFDSPERKTISPDPIRHLASTSQTMIRSVI